MLRRPLFAVLCSFLLCLASAQEWLTIERYTDYSCNALDSILGIDFGCQASAPGYWTHIQDLTNRVSVTTNCTDSNCFVYTPGPAVNSFGGSDASFGGGSASCSPNNEVFTYGACELYSGGYVIFRRSLKADPLPVPSSIGEYQYYSGCNPDFITIGWGPFSSATAGYRKGTTHPVRTLA